MKPILFFGIFFILFCNSIGYAQNDINLIDGRETQNCEECKLQIKRKPAEVLFGININANGDVYFTMTSKKWFDIIFKNEKYGLTIDLITRDRYKCSNKNEIGFTLPSRVSYARASCSSSQCEMGVAIVVTPHTE